MIKPFAKATFNLATGSTVYPFKNCVGLGNHAVGLDFSTLVSPACVSKARSSDFASTGCLGEQFQDSSVSGVLFGAQTGVASRESCICLQMGDLQMGDLQMGDRWFSLFFNQLFAPMRSRHHRDLLLSVPSPDVDSLFGAIALMRHWVQSLGFGFLGMALLDTGLNARLDTNSQHFGIWVGLLGVVGAYNLRIRFGDDTDTNLRSGMRRLLQPFSSSG